MEYGNAITKDTLRTLLDQTPDTQQNARVRQALVSLITRKSVQPVPYTYTANYTAAGAANGLAAGVVNAVVNVPIQADADFLILNQTYSVNSLNAAATRATTPVPLVSVTLIDTGSGYQWMDSPVDVDEIFGNGQFPYVLPNPKLMVAKSTLQVLASNHDAAAGYNLRLAFNGVKLLAFN